FRTDLPFVAKDPISSDDPSGDYLYGVGDTDFQAALIEQINQQWAAGGGLRIIAPTGPDNITSGKWQMMPIVGARTMLPELSAGSYFQGVVRYDLSFAGDSTKKNISNLQLWPVLNISLPDHWFFILYPSADIRVNYGDTVTGQTGRLFLPFDFSVGRSLTKNFTVSLEVGSPVADPDRAGLASMRADAINGNDSHNSSRGTWSACVAQARGFVVGPALRAVAFGILGLFCNNKFVQRNAGLPRLRRRHCALGRQLRNYDNEGSTSCSCGNRQ